MVIQRIVESFQTRWVAVRFRGFVLCLVFQLVALQVHCLFLRFAPSPLLARGSPSWSDCQCIRSVLFPGDGDGG